MSPKPTLSPQEAADLVIEHGSIRQAAKQVNKSFDTVRRAYQKAVDQGIAQQRTHADNRRPGQPKPEESDPTYALEGRIEPLYTKVRSIPRHGVRRYIITSAQNNTKLFEPGWRNLLALRQYYDAELMVSRFTYNLSAYGSGSVKPGQVKTQDALWYDPEITPFIVDERVEIAPGLIFCGEINVLPTGKRPLSGFETYTGRKSGIFPHAKVAMESIPSGKYEPTKFNYTTGACTLRNYIAKKAGQIADFHHSYSALMVEVESCGDWFVRQLHMDNEGAIYDWDVKVSNGVVTQGHPVEAITWADIHCHQMDPVMKQACWSPGGMIDELRPSYQFFHDLFDHYSRNHHERGNPHAMFKRHVEGNERIEDELEQTAEFCRFARRDYCQSVIVDSNHDNALERWVKDTTPHQDPVNAIFWHEASLAKYRALERRDYGFHMLEWALRRHGCGAERFLREDESFVVCPDRGGGIECGMHGHLGPSGAKGSLTAFAKMGRKKNVGHMHSAGIKDDVYVSGKSGNYEYERGPSSGSMSHTLTYANGKRTIVTMWRGKYRAMGE